MKKNITISAIALISTIFVAGCTNPEGFLPALLGIPQEGGSSTTTRTPNTGAGMGSVTPVQREAQAYARSLFK